MRTLSGARFINLRFYCFFCFFFGDSDIIPIRQIGQLGSIGALFIRFVVTELHDNYLRAYVTVLSYNSFRNF